MYRSRPLGFTAPDQLTNAIRRRRGGSAAPSAPLHPMAGPGTFASADAALGAAALSPSSAGAAPQDIAAHAAVLQASGGPQNVDNPIGSLQAGLAAATNPAPHATAGYNANTDLGGRRAVLYGQAIQRAQNLQPGEKLSAGTVRRLSLGAGGPHSGDTFAPHSLGEVQALSAHLPTILDALRKRKADVSSTAGIYKSF